MKLFNLALFIIMFFVTQQAISDNTDYGLALKRLKQPLPKEGIQPFGMEQYCKDSDCVASLFMFKRLYVTPPSSNPRPFSAKEQLGFSDKNAIYKAESIFNAKSSLALLMVDDGKIVYEKYKPGFDKDTPFFGFSMTKSVAGLTLGAAHCAGYIENLDIPAKKYNKALEGTAQGDATVRQLLTMSSGGYRGANSTGWMPVHGWRMGDYYYFGYADLELMIHDYGGYQQKKDGVDVKSGEEFSYKNLDASAISLVIGGEDPKQFQTIFEKHLASKIGFENNVYWVHDSKGYTHTHAGFLATTRDWGRIADFVIQAANAKPGDCLEDFVKDATKSQIKNRSKFHGDNFYTNDLNDGYGYFFWTDLNISGPSKSVQMLGYLGQLISINLTGKKFVVLISKDWDADAQGRSGFYQLFNRF